VQVTMQRIYDAVDRMLEDELPDTSTRLSRILTSQAQGFLWNFTRGETLTLIRALLTHVQISITQGLWMQVRNPAGWDLIKQRNPEEILGRKRRAFIKDVIGDVTTLQLTVRENDKKSVADEFSDTDNDFMSVNDTLASIGSAQNIVIAKSPVKPPSKITVWDDKTKLKLNETWSTYVRSYKRNAQPSGEIIDIMDQKLLYTLAEFRFDEDLEKVTSDLIHADIASVVSFLQQLNSPLATRCLSEVCGM